MDMVKDHWYTLCWSAKWLGSKEMLSAGIYSSSKDDKEIMLKLWKLFDEADIVVAHNAVRFDCRKANARFLYYGINPPSPYAIVDTLKVARKHFAIMSNRLNDLGVFLDVGKKIKTGGFELWEKCMAGDKVAWDKMVRYCKQDVRLLERIYLKLRPYMKSHPNLAVIEDRDVCPRCTSKKIQYRGSLVTNGGKYKRFQCQDCGAWGSDRKNQLDNKVGKSQ